MSVNTDWTRIQQGDQRAFEVIFKEHYQMLCTFAFHYLKDHDEAEEVVQQLFFNLWKNRGQISVQKNISGYLMQSVKNHCLNKIKKWKTEQGYAGSMASNENEHSDTPHDHAVSNELEQKVLELIDLLPPERQKVFVMSRLQGKKYKEIAESLHISVKTVENQMGKALKYLRTHLQEYLSILLIVMYAINILHRIGVFELTIVISL
jgi:RNA polymerase sigma-70 factor (ECF subfamily)